MRERLAGRASLALDDLHRATVRPAVVAVDRFFPPIQPQGGVSSRSRGRQRCPAEAVSPQDSVESWGFFVGPTRGERSMLYPQWLNPGDNAWQLTAATFVGLMRIPGLVVLWGSCVYTINAFLIWGGGYFAHHGAVDFSGGYVIHLSAGVSGFIAAWVIGPRLARDREVDAPNNLAMVAVGAGLLWMGWNGFNGGDPYNAGADAASAVLNTNLATAVAFLVWVGCDYATKRKPSLIGSVNGMIVGLVAITPAAGFVNGFGAIAIGASAAVLVYVALHYLASHT